MSEYQTSSCLSGRLADVRKYVRAKRRSTYLSNSTAIKKGFPYDIFLYDILLIYFFSSPLLRRILTADYSHDLHNTATRSNSETSLVSSTLGSNQLCSDLFNDDTECLIPSENNSPRHRQLRLERVMVSSDFILIGFLIARSIQ